MLVLLSSAQRPRYEDDIVRVLALPAGAQMQFRYAQGWVEPGVLQQVSGEKLADKPILVCFLAGDGKTAPFEIVPIRHARLIRAELVGSSCIFIFEAGPFVADLDDAAVRRAAHVLTRPKLPGPVPASSALFAFECNLPRPHPTNRMNLTAFENAVGRVCSHSPFQTADTVFYTLFRVSRLRKFSWFGTWPRPRVPSSSRMGSYLLPSGGRYECEVYCLRPSDPTTGEKTASLDLGITADDNTQLNFVSATHNHVDSKYDVKRFVFQSDYAVLDRLTGFRLFLWDATQNRAYRDISLPVILKRSHLLGIGKFVLVLVGTAAAAMIAARGGGKDLDSTTVGLLVLVAILTASTAVFPTVKKP